MKFFKHVNLTQIRALLRKDLLVRLRQPWMTIIQYLWPCAIFMSLYILRNRFQPVEIKDCQFQTRQLPSNGLIPFFQSYICSIENECVDPNKFEEVDGFTKTPVTPLFEIIQTFISDEKLYNTIINLPIDKNFISTVTVIAMHKSFKIIENNADTVIRRFPEIEKMVGANFDILKVFGDSQMFSDAGKILCGKPFPRSDNLRIVDNILYSEDYNGPDKGELEVMPTPYCKQLYLDVVKSNQGKITWAFLKPIIQGKIIYGPESDRNDEIVREANRTFVEMDRLKNFFYSLNTTVKLLKQDEEMRRSFESLVDLIRSPLIQALFGNSINVTMIEGLLRGVLENEQVEIILETVSNILTCYSVDRFVPIKDEKQLEEKAFEMNEKKLFYAGIFFDEPNHNEVSYKLRMEIDSTPVTFENKNRFWFPGPEASMEFDMRYHRGFVQIQQSLDVGIIRMQKKKLIAKIKDNMEADDPFSLDDDEDEDEEEDAIDVTKSPLNISQEVKSDDDLKTTAKPKISSDEDDDDDDWDWGDDDEDEKVTTVKPQRRKRAPQFDLLSYVLDRKMNNDNNLKVEIDEAKFFTKQFPYPKYTKDEFKKGLYMAQAVQLSFFIALIVQISSSVRQRIWMKESGNNMLMRTMGLKASSETISWCFTTFVELALVFILAIIIIYSGGILEKSSRIFIYTFLVFYGLCIISFCYMCSTFFMSASIGSVASAILFLTTFLPYIIIVSMGAELTDGFKFLANLSFSTAFCYAWRYVMRMELQHKELNFGTFFANGVENNDFLFGILMIILDLILYAIIGHLIEKFWHVETKFYDLKRVQLDQSIGGMLKNVDKIYENNKKAIDNVSITFKRDEITCLLGRNGAGKSTIIKLLTGQILPTSGEVNLPLDYDIISGHVNNQEKIGLCSQNDVLIPNLTAKEHLEMYARIKMNKGFQIEVKRVMKILKLGNYENFKVKDLSGGYKRRLCIAIAFLGSPNLVILDEPCSSVDTKARKNIWDLIEELRKDRAVVLATHHLEEAEHLSDNVITMGNGQVISESNLDQLRERFTKTFSINIFFPKSSSENDRQNILNDIKSLLDNNVHSDIQMIENELYLTVPYFGDDEELINYETVLQKLEALQQERKLLNFKIISENLQDLFNSVNKIDNLMNGTHDENMNADDVLNINMIEGDLSTFEIIKNLFWKRFLHFKRNYRLLLCILVLPALFEIIAMGFMKIRPTSAYETALMFSRALYPGSTEFFSKQGNLTAFETESYNYFTDQCRKDCEYFNRSEDVYKWLLKTNDDYIERRYGGVTVNQDKNVVWYNNKGFHSMPLYLNILNSAMLKAEMNDTSYNIKTVNHPLLLGGKELSYSSILSQVADAGISLIIAIAFSLVIAGASVYIVSERISGEKLQQELSGVSFKTYWGVTFIWDYAVYLIAMLLAIIIFVSFALPIYVAKDNLGGICLILFLYGFASILAVHVFEKLFNDASFANMSIFCLNFIIAMFTTTTIVLFDVLGETDEAEMIRNFLNRAFLIFPQHAFADALISICQNHIQSEIFSRYYIDTYKSPVTSDLLMPHYIALVVMGCVFMFINYILEHKYIQSLMQKIQYDKEIHNYELEIISIQNSLKKDQKPTTCPSDVILKINNLTKMYGATKVVSNVSFYVKNGECLGLLGTNGAGKSTIFSILSGQQLQTTGGFEFFGKEGLSYCPQTNALDLLLTVEEVIKFYGKLRKIKNLNELVQETLRSYHLEPYKTILVKNLSGGNRRKLSVAVTCFGNTNLVLMDEPTSDMDPVTRALVYKTIHKMNKSERSVLLTSHSISEIDKICQRLAILKDGKLITIGTPSELNENYGNGYVVTLFVVDRNFDNIEDLIKNEFPTAENMIRHNGSLQFNMKVSTLESYPTNHANGNGSCSITFQIRSKDRLLLSDLFKKLHKFSSNHSHRVMYTVSACLLDQVFESILEDENEAYSNTAFTADN